MRLQIDVTVIRLVKSLLACCEVTFLSGFTSLVESMITANHSLLIIPDQSIFKGQIFTVYTEQILLLSFNNIYFTILELIHVEISLRCLFSDGE